MIINFEFLGENFMPLLRLGNSEAEILGFKAGIRPVYGWDKG